MHLRRSLAALFVLCRALCAVGFSTPALGQATTTVTLASFSGTVPANTAIQLVASVHDASGPALSGQISFFDGSHILATIPVVRISSAGRTPGTATLPRIFSPGTHNIHVTFDGTATEQPSSSSSSPLTVQGAGTSPGPGLVYFNSRYLNQLTELESFVVTDINQDGVLDLVAPQFGFPNIAVALGDPANPGAFFAPSFVPTLTGSNAVVASDLNGDGLPDLLVTNTNDNQAFIVYQNSANPGTFLPEQAAGATQAKALVADMNHDGLPDLILFPLIGGQSTVAVYLADPLHPGSFLVPQTTTPLSGNDLRTTAVADMNGDGLPDIVIGNYNAQTVSVILNDPTNPGHLLGPFDYPSAAPSYSIALGDLNNDGLPDVVLGGVSSGVVVMLGNPAHPGQLLAATSYPVSPTPAGGRSLGVAIGDVDGDGIPDIASGNAGPVFDLLLGRGDGTFKSTIPYNTGPTPASFEGVSMSIADVDGDGANDVLVGQFFQNNVQVFLHQSPSPQRVITATDLTTASVVQLGTPITVSIKVSSAAGPPPGSVTLYDSSGGATFVPVATTIPLDATGSAVYTNAAPSVGFHDFVATFPGDNIYSPSTSIIVQVVVVNHSTASLSLSPSANPAIVGQPVTFTATVTAIGTPPTGSIIFLDTGTQIGFAPLVGGSATFTTSSLVVGTHSIQAVYSGDTNYPSQSATIAEVIRYTPAAISLTSSANPSTVGQSVTFSADVTATGPAPTGQVAFFDGGQQFASVPLPSNGVATFTTTGLTAGTHAITVTYSGDGNYNPQSKSLQQVVNLASSSTTVVAAPNQALFGTLVNIAAAVNGTATTPTGTITFYDGAASIGVAMLNSAGQASLTTSSLAVGSHALTAVYSGSSTYAASTSAPFTEVIQPLPQDFTITLASPSISIKTQHHTTTSLTLASVSGFADSLTLSCANLPQYVTCQPTPNPASLIANGTTSVSVYLDTDSVLGYAHLITPAPPAPFKDRSAPISLALLLSPLSLLALSRKSRRAFGVPRLIALLLALLPLSLALSGCGEIILPYDPPPFATPGTYTIPITAVGATSHISHTTNLTLTITP